MCLNSSSASVTRPAFINFNAAAYCCAACGGTGAASGIGAGFVGAPATAVVPAADVLSRWALADAGAAGVAGAAPFAAVPPSDAPALFGAAVLLGAAALLEAVGAGDAEPPPLGAELGTAASAFTVPSAPRFTMYKAGACESS